MIFNKFKIIQKTLLLILVLALPQLTFAQEETAETDERPIMYFPISPNLVTFYTKTSGSLGYAVIEIQVKVRGQENYDLVDAHLPLLQDNLTDFFNRQDRTVIQDLQQREKLRAQATARLQKAISEETGVDVIETLLFTRYLFQ